MSLPEVRAVLARDSAATAAARATAAELAALATAAAHGSADAAKQLTARLEQLHWLAGHEEPEPEPAEFEGRLAALFGAAGIRSDN